MTVRCVGSGQCQSAGVAREPFLATVTVGFLDTQGQVIVEEKYPDAPDEPFGVDTVDLKIQPYLCSRLTDPVR